MTQSSPKFENNPIIVLLLGFVTCGLYLIYWNYKAAQVMNAVAEKEAISPAIAVIAGCISPVNIYFYYLVGKDCMPALYSKVGEPAKDQSVLLMVLGLLIPIVAAMIVQGEINKLYVNE